MGVFALAQRLWCVRRPEVIWEIGFVKDSSGSDLNLWRFLGSFYISLSLS